MLKPVYFQITTKAMDGLIRSEDPSQRIGIASSTQPRNHENTGHLEMATSHWFKMPELPE